jgi:hypothetical protein
MYLCQRKCPQNFFVISTPFSVKHNRLATGDILLTFEGIGSNVLVGNFYQALYGITFAGTAIANIDSDAGGTGNFGGEPSPNTAIAMHQGATMNVPAGFTIGLSFWYSIPHFYIAQPIPTISLYSGVNGGGS